MHKVNAEWRIVFYFETYGMFYMEPKIQQCICTLENQPKMNNDPKHMAKKRNLKMVYKGSGDSAPI